MLPVELQVGRQSPLRPAFIRASKSLRYRKSDFRTKKDRLMALNDKKSRQIYPVISGLS